MMKTSGVQFDLNLHFDLCNGGQNKVNAWPRTPVQCWFGKKCRESERSLSLELGAGGDRSLYFVRRCISGQNKVNDDSKNKSQTALRAFFVKGNDLTRGSHRDSPRRFELREFVLSGNIASKQNNV